MKKKEECEMLKSMKWLFLLSGFLFVVMGMKMLFTPLDGLVVMAFYIGISMLLSGVSEISLYFNSEPEKRSAWMLAEGMLATLLGIWAVFGRSCVSRGRSPWQPPVLKKHACCFWDF